MIKSIVISFNSKKETIQDHEIVNNKIIFKNSVNFIDDFRQIEIVFNSKITSFRNHDYSWISINEDCIATDFSPKTIKLENGTYIQPNINVGVWEVSSKNIHKLIWKFKSDFLCPITEYSENNNVKKISSAQSTFDLLEDLVLLFSKHNAIEISRSKIPFSAIACFTDHCDYDTLENLKMQRTFFKKINLKITKGFFLNHFSKRDDNASWENNQDELILWKNDGHELCYHSLSQSIKSDEESFNDFNTFVSPINDIPVWIDHGFQPYNFSLFKNSNIENKAFEDILVSKNIQTLWNYIDCGTASNGIINQLNSKQYTLKNYLFSIQSERIKSKIVKLVKAIIFHYDNDKNRIRNYIDSISAVRKLVKRKNPLALFHFIKNILPVAVLILKTFMNWNSVKNKPFKAAKFSPILFEHQIFKREFHIFQTIEMVDFINGLSKDNVDLLVAEKGVFIAHTYFSVDMNHHRGKLFCSKNELDNIVVQNFEYLSKNIKEQNIWNPTLTELILYYKNYTKTILDINENGTIFMKNNTNIPSRKVQ